MDTKKLRADAYGLLKALVVPLVILAHITVMYTADGAFHCVRSDNLLVAISAYIYSFHMPVFFMLSGCVYGLCIRSGKYRRPGQFLLKKSKRLLVPYVLYGLLIVVPVVYLCGFEDKTIPQAWLQNIGLAIQPRHLWYVLVLFEIFVLTVPLRGLCEKKPLIVLLLSAAVFTAATVLLPKDGTNYLQYRNLLTYQLYFFFGVCLDSAFDTLRKWTLRLKWLWILLPAAQASCLYVCNVCPQCKVLYGLLGCVWVLCGAILLNEYLPRLGSSRFIKSLGDCGYGIYLLHPMMVYGIFFFVRNWNVHPLLLTAAVFVTVTAVSWLLMLLWHKLTRRKKAS